jgi:hypothetical protein
MLRNRKRCLDPHERKCQARRGEAAQADPPRGRPPVPRRRFPKETAKAGQMRARQPAVATTHLWRIGHRGLINVSVPELSIYSNPHCDKNLSCWR